MLNAEIIFFSTYTNLQSQLFCVWKYKIIMSLLVKKVYSETWSGLT